MWGGGCRYRADKRGYFCPGREGAGARRFHHYSEQGVALAGSLRWIAIDLRCVKQENGTVNEAGTVVYISTVCQESEGGTKLTEVWRILS